MGMELKAVIGRLADLKEWQQTLPATAVCRFSGDLTLVPLTSRLLGEIWAWARAGGAEEPRKDLAATQAWLAHASAGTFLVYADIFEFGDMGHEEYEIWENGALVESRRGAGGVIERFKQLGVDPGSDFDLEKYRGETAAEKWAAAESI